MLCKQGLYCVGLVRLNCDVFWVDKNCVDYFVSVGAVNEGIYLENLETKNHVVFTIHSWNYPASR